MTKKNGKGSGGGKASPGNSSLSLSHRSRASIGQRTSHIRNKARRTVVYHELKKRQKEMKKKERIKRQEKFKDELDAYSRQVQRGERDREVTKAGMTSEKKRRTREEGTIPRQANGKIKKKATKRQEDSDSDSDGDGDSDSDVSSDDSGEEKEESDDDDDDDDDANGSMGEEDEEEDEEEEKGAPLVRPQKRQPITIESERIRDDDESAVVTSEQMAEDEIVKMCAAGRQPKVLITTTRKPSAGMFAFVAELLTLFPRAAFYKRRDFQIKEIVKYAIRQSFTAVIVINEDRKVVNGLLHINLPLGPTAYYKLTNLKLAKDIFNHGRPTDHSPEIILKNFSTRTGHRVAHMFASLFAPNPHFRGRRVVTFQNQRDFIFVRHHRYIFDEKEKVPGNEKKPRRITSRLQPLGPHFTLRLLWLQASIFDSKRGTYVWKRDVHGKSSDKIRRKFAL